MEIGTISLFLLFPIHPQEVIIMKSICVLLGVVLKKARMKKKGKRNVNVDDGVVIDTLIVLSGDLVQVVATVCN